MYGQVQYKAEITLCDDETDPFPCLLWTGDLTQEHVCCPVVVC